MNEPTTLNDTYGLVLGAVSAVSLLIDQENASLDQSRGVLMGTEAILNQALRQIDSMLGAERASRG